MENTSIQQFIDSLKKEVSTLREILANLSLEELCLTKADKEGHGRIKEELSELYLHLDIARDVRKKAALRAFPGHLDPENALPLEDDYRCEVTFWQEQLSALTNKMKDQTIQNEFLSKVGEALPAKEPIQKRKNGIATLPPTSD